MAIKSIEIRAKNWLRKKKNRGMDLDEIKNNCVLFFQKSKKKIMKQKKLSSRGYEKRKDFVLRCINIIDYDPYSI